MFLNTRAVIKKYEMNEKTFFAYNELNYNKGGFCFEKRKAEY